MAHLVSPMQRWWCFGMARDAVASASMCVVWVAHPAAADVTRRCDAWPARPACVSANQEPNGCDVCPARLLCFICRVAPARIACLDMNLQKARMQMGVQVRTQTGSAAWGGHSSVCVGHAVSAL
jgi:hypothetical protein